MTNPNNPESTNLVKTNPLDQIVVSPKDKIAAQGTALDADKVAEEDYKRQVRQKELDKQDLVNQELASNIQARRVYAGRIFMLLCLYIVMSLCIVIFAGLGKLKLTDAVLLMLLGTGTVNVIGIFTLVAKYLFYIPEKPKPDKPAKPVKPAKSPKDNRKLPDKEDNPPAIEAGNGTNEETA